MPAYILKKSCSSNFWALDLSSKLYLKHSVKKLVDFKENPDGSLGVGVFGSHMRRITTGWFGQSTHGGFLVACIKNNFG